MTSRMLCAGLVLALLTGCEMSGRGIDAACGAFRPVYVSRADVLTDGTAEQVLAHNLTGARLCGWQSSAGNSAGDKRNRDR